jgi:hypothetical protein
MSTPRIDFEVNLNRELTAIGASDREADTCVQGVRRGGVLVLATGSNEQVDNAATIMNARRNGACRTRRQSTGKSHRVWRKPDADVRWLAPDRAAAPACSFGCSRENASMKTAGGILMRRLHSRRQLVHLSFLSAGSWTKEVFNHCHGGQGNVD